MQAVQHSPALHNARQEQPAAPPPQRSLLIDIAKGLAITLVALGHTNQGELARGYWGAAPFGIHLNAWIYSFHMPAFFFLSGVFLRPSLEKRGLRGLVVQKARTLLYPFLVWSLFIPLATMLLALVFTLRPLHLEDVLLNLVTGNAAWFLPALFVALVLAALLQRIPIFLLLPGACLAAFLWPPTHILAIDRGVWHLPFVVAGMALGERILRLERVPAAAALAAAAVLALGLYVAVSRLTSAAAVHWGLLPAGFYGTGMLLLFGRCLVPSSLARVCARVGQASLWVFLLAPFPQGLVRVLLAHAGCLHPVAHLILPTLAAVALPTWLYQQRDRFRLNLLFALPGRSCGRSEAWQRDHNRS